MKTFIISQILSQDLMSRPLAKDLYTYIKNTKETDVIIDFTGVNFATRSFMDEFYNVFIKSSDIGFNVTLTNMPSDIDAILNAVKATQNTKKQLSDAKISKTKTLKDVDKCFSALCI